MNNPFKAALAALLPGAGRRPPPAAENPPPAAGDVPASKAPAPAVAATTTSFKPELAREAEKQHSRQIGHLLKAASRHRPVITRSVPHARGR